MQRDTTQCIIKQQPPNLQKPIATKNIANRKNVSWPKPKRKMLPKTNERSKCKELVAKVKQTFVQLLYKRADDHSLETEAAGSK